MAESQASQQLGVQVRGQLATLAGYLALVTRTNPTGSADALLARPDVEALLHESLADAYAQAAAVLEQVWFVSGAPSSDEYLRLQVDLARTFGAVPHLRGLVRHAHASVPPGTGLSAGADRRAAAVRDAVLAAARKIALSARMTVSHADVAAVTAAQLARGPEMPRARKTWRRDPASSSCWWCRRLDGVTLAPRESFAAYLPGPARVRGVLVHPPRLYRSDLQGPPLHPFCDCGVDMTSAGAAGGLPSGVSQVPGSLASGAPAGPAGFLSADDIRAMPEARYQADLAFLRAAAHELGQVLGRLAEGSGGLR